MLKQLALTALIMGVSTVIGTLIGFLFRRIPHKYNDCILGSAAGFMLAAAILGLILPAISHDSAYAVPMTLAGMLAGAFLVSILDVVTPHLHHLAGLDMEKHPADHGTGRVLLFIAAIAIHKLPEGLAAGVSFGTENMSDILTVAGSISLQNIPEAMVIVAPLLQIGVTRRRTLLISCAIAGISMLSTAAGYALITVTAPLLPFILAFAGGAMLYVVSDEMIPETHAHGHEKLATFSLLGGFMVTLILQNIIG